MMGCVAHYKRLDGPSAMCELAMRVAYYAVAGSK
jgi:hypothetical protein